MVDQPLRVLHINAGNLYGGIETLLVTLARERANCPGIEQHFALFFEGRLSEELRRFGVPVHLLNPVRVSRPWTVLSARQKLKMLLKAIDADIVLTHGCWNHAIAAPVARRLQRKVVFWGHMLESGKGWLARWARRSPPDVVLANSYATAKAVSENLFPSVPSEVLYLPVSPPPKLDREAIRREIRRQLGTTEDTVVIIMASRMESLKGHHNLILALKELDNLHHWECWIAGDAQREKEKEYLRSVQKLIEQQHLITQVRLIGHRNDLCKILSAADIYCQPNDYPESFGVSFVEALYAGLPVITFAFGGAVEIVTPSCGVLIDPPGDVSGLAIGLKKLIEDRLLRERMATAGPVRAISLCDPIQQGRRFSQILKEIKRR